MEEKCKIRLIVPYYKFVIRKPGDDSAHTYNGKIITIDYEVELLLDELKEDVNYLYIKLIKTIKLHIEKIYKLLFNSSYNISREVTIRKGVTN